MTSKEIDEAMRQRLPVQWRGEKYERILEYISQYDDNCRRTLSVGLLKERAIYRVRAEEVEVWNEKMQ